MKPGTVPVRRRVELVDTCVLVDLLDIPNEAHDHDLRLTELQRRQAAGITLHLPVATVIETGQHIQRLGSGYGAERRRCAEKFDEVLRTALLGADPWTFRPVLWDEDLLTCLLDQRPPYPLSLVQSLATKNLEMGDLTILAELRRLRANLGRYVDVDVWTLDGGLRAAVNSLAG